MMATRSIMAGFLKELVGKPICIFLQGGPQINGTISCLDETDTILRMSGNSRISDGCVAVGKEYIVAISAITAVEVK